MSEFSIKTKEVRNKVNDIQICSNKIDSSIGDIENIMNNLGFSVDYRVKNSLKTILSRLESEKQYMFALADALENCVNKYENTESKLTVPGAEINQAIVEASAQISEQDDDSYLMEALKQILLGSWTDDVNLLGTTVSVILGLIPVVGLILDIRDWTGDIKNLCTDGATSGEWVCFALDSLAIALDFVDAGELVTPFKLAVKNGDSIVDVAKSLGKSASKNIDEYVDIVKNVFKNNDWSKVSKGFVENADTYVREIKELPNTLKHPQELMDTLTKSGRTINTTIQDWVGEVQDMFSDFMADDVVGYAR